MTLSLHQAQDIVTGALKAARDQSASPLAVIVLDAGGNPVAFAREDKASLFRFDIARAKAMGALGMGADTRAIAARAEKNPTFFTTVAIASQGNLALSPGGVLVRNAAGDVIGAVGISGDTGDVDETCALAGMTAAGLGRKD